MTDEDKEVRIVVHGTPAPKGSPRVITKGRGGVPLKAPRVIKDSEETENWHALVAHAAEEAMSGRKPFFQQALSVRTTFYLLRPQGHYGVRGLRPSAPRWPKTKPDLDKLLRATMDPLENVVFDGDSRIVEHVARKAYAELGESIRAEIVIAEMRIADDAPTEDEQ